MGGISKIGDFIRSGLGFPKKETASYLPGLITILPGVVVFGFKGQLWRELRIAGIQPLDVVIVGRFVGAVIRREWEGDRLKQTISDSSEGPPQPPDQSVTESRRIPLRIVDIGHGVNNFRGSIEHIPQSTAKFAGWSLFRLRWGLDIGKCRRDTRQKEEN